jgi:exopolysaccharide production protein ExoZ
MMIGNIQALRAFAAIGVVFYHTNFHIFGMHTDFFGVPTFFVISGFIMCFIAAKDPARFFERRLIRIVPMWLICLTVAASLFQKLNTENAIWYLKSALFIPSDRFPILGVGWTLNFEMYFYALFAIAIAINARLAPVMTAAALGAVFAGAALFPGSFLLTYYSQGYVWYFLGGIVVFYATRRLSAVPMPPVAAAIGMIALYAAILLLPLVAEQSVVLTYAFKAWPMFIVAWALFAARSGADIRSRLLLLLGEASYSIYLVHTIAMEKLYSRVIPRDWASANIWVALFVVAFATAVGVIVHLLVEKPVDKAIHRWLEYRRLRSAEIASRASQA